MPLKRNIIANYVGQGWSAVMGMAFIPLYIRYLGIEAYGLIGMFAVMQAWLTMLDIGMTPTLNREMARYTAGYHSRQSINDLLRTLEIIAICIATTICFMTWSASDFVASEWLRADKLPLSVVAKAIAIMGIVVALRFVESIYRGALFGLQQQVWYNTANASIATLRHGGAALVLVLVSPTVQAFFIWQIGISTFSVAIMSMGVRRALPSPPLVPKFTLAAIAEVWKFAGGMMLTTVLAILLTQVDKILVSKLLSLELFGYYTLASTVAGLLYVVIAPITTAFYPRMVELATQDDQVRLAHIYHQSAQLVTVLTAPAALLLSCYAEEVLLVWSGDEVLASRVAPLLSIFVIGVFLNCLMHIPAQLQLASGWVSLGIKTNIVAVAVLVPAIFWVVPHYGAIGASWIWVLLNAGYILIAVQIMHRRLFLREKWTWYFSDVLLPVIGALGVMILSKLVRPTLHQSRWSELFFMLAVGMIALFVSALLANRVRPRLLRLFKRVQVG